MDAVSAHVTRDLGAYAIGALEPAEQLAAEEHLAGCAACRERLAEFEPLPPLLALLSLDDVVPPPARAARPRRRVVMAAAGLAVAASLIGAVTLLNRPAGTTTVSAAAPGTAFRAKVDVTDDPSGARLTLRLTGATPHETCALVAVDRGGHREVAGWWLADYEGEAVVHGQTAIRAGDLARFEIVDGQRRTLLTVPITS